MTSIYCPSSQVGELEDVKEVNTAAVANLTTMLARIERSAAKEPARGRFKSPAPARGARTPGAYPTPPAGNCRNAQTWLDVDAM